MADQSIFILVIITVRCVTAAFQSSSSNSTNDTTTSQCPSGLQFNLTGGVLDESTGTIVKFGYVFPPESTWFEGDEVLGCACYNRSTCSPLYCPIGAVMHQRTYYDCEAESYLPSDFSEEPLLFSIDSPIEQVTMNKEIYIAAEHYTGGCHWIGKTVRVVNETVEDGIYTYGNGSIYVPGKNVSAMYNFDGYCLCSDSNIKFWEYSPACIRSGVIFTGVARYDPELDKMTEGTSIIAHIGMIVSVPFLLITFVVYTILPELRNVHGLALRGYVGSLSVAYTTLIVIQTTGPISEVACLIFAFTIYFSFITSFFWLNAMCFDIWWTFGGFRSIRGKVNQRDRKKYVMFSVYVFGCSILMTCFTMAMNFIPEIPHYMIRPEFGMDSLCWFKTNEARALYFYGPMGVTIICNIFFFVSTAVKIIRHKKNTAHHLKGGDSKRHDDNKQWFNLYLKLFVVMGINWSMEIAAWLFKDLEYIWYFTDLANALQGVIIFIIFICKKNVKRMLLKRFGCQSVNLLSSDSATRSGTRSTVI